MNRIVHLLLAMLLLPATVWAQSAPRTGTFRFQEGGLATYNEIARGDTSMVDTLVFTYGGSGCADLGRDWLPRLADGLGIDARYIALNKRHVVIGAISDGGGATCSAVFNQHNTPRQWMADYMEFISRMLEEQPQRWKKVVLVGGSEGGALAVRVARARADVTHLLEGNRALS